MATPPRLRPEDIAPIFGLYEPGAVIPARVLYERYCFLARMDGGTPDTIQAFSRAMGRLNVERVVIRKGRGPRGAQKFSETHCYIIPGRVGEPIYPEDRRMNAVLAKFGDGIHPKYKIENEYADMARREGWAYPMSKSEIGKWMKSHGYVTLWEGRRTCWYVPGENIRHYLPEGQEDQFQMSPDNVR